MCIVSRQNNYIFFHIPKCGGTSVSEILPNKEKVRLIEHTHYDYISSKSIFYENNEANWFESAKKFSIIRNPYDRTVSLYRYIREHHDHPLHDKMMNYTFTQFCYFLKNVGDESIKSCYQHLVDDNGFIDKSVKFFRLESINNHLDEISDIVGIKINEIPHINTSNSYYEKTDESDLLIKDIFIEDFEFFYQELL